MLTQAQIGATQTTCTGNRSEIFLSLGRVIPYPCGREKDVKYIKNQTFPCIYGFVELFL